MVRARAWCPVWRERGQCGESDAEPGCRATKQLQGETKVRLTPRRASLSLSSHLSDPCASDRAADGKGCTLCTAQRTL